MRLVWFALSLVAPVVLCGGSAPALSYEPDEVTLVGTVRRETFPGRPNYEDITKGDELEVYWILQLRKPVDVIGAKDADIDVTECAVREVQLVFGVLSKKSYPDYRDLLGKPVIVTGSLYHAISAHHKTAVLIQVRDMKKEPKNGTKPKPASVTAPSAKKTGGGSGGAAWGARLRCGLRCPGGEAIDRGGAVGPAGGQDGAGEVGVVDGVGEMLGLQAEAAAVRVGLPGFAGEGAVEEIAAVELQAGFGREHLEHAAGVRFVQARGQHRLGAAAGRQREVVVVAEAELQLRVVGRDALADRMRRGEVKGRAAHGGDFAGRDQAAIHRGVGVGIDLEFMAEDGPTTLAAEIEVAVVGEVQRCAAVGRGVVVDLQPAVGRQRISDLDLQGARVTFVAIGTGVAQPQGGPAREGQGLRLPEDFVEPDPAPVQVTGDAAGLVVSGEGVVPAIEGEAAAGDAIADAADQRAEVGRFVGVARHVGEAEHDVGQGTLAVGGQNPHHASAVVRNVDLKPFVALQRIQMGLAPIRRTPKRPGFRHLGHQGNSGHDTDEKEQG